MKDDFIRVIKSKGAETAIQQLNRQGDVLRALVTYDQLVRDLYWKEKNLPASIAIAQAAIEYALEHAELTDNDELADDYRAKAKTISYNLASYTCPGWNEPGITISAEEIQIGLRAAEQNLELALSLNRDPLRVGYAHWVLGAQRIAVKDLPAAKSDFAKSAALAAEVEEHSAVLLAKGFEALVDMLATPHDAAAKKQYAQIKSELEQVEHGDEYIQQLHNAWKVFS